MGRGILAGVFVLALLVGCREKMPGGSSPDGYDPQVGGPGLNFTISLLDGTTLDGATLQGRVVLINFWDTWCGPCRQEQPDLNALYNDYRDRGLEIVGVALAMNGISNVASYVAASGVAYPSGIIGSSIQATYGFPPVIPRTFVVNRAGLISSEHTGRMSYNDLQEAISPYLGE